MTTRFAYDLKRNPPAPILPVRLGRPGADPHLFLTALVDTGADATVIPQALAGQLDLPVLGEVIIGGTGGVRQRATVHAAVLEVAGSPWPAEVIALGAEPLLGRDLLNRWVVTLRGPDQILDVQAPGPRPKAR